MSIFGKKSPELRKAEEQRKIDKLKNKTKEEQIKLKAKEARVEARAKAGGVGGSFTVHDRRSIPQSSNRRRK